MKHTTYILMLLVNVFILSSTHAQDRWWDRNGTDDGCGGATNSMSGLWNNDNWCTEPNGGNPSTSFGFGNRAVFSAGTDGGPSFVVTVSQYEQVGGIVVEEGSVTLAASGSGAIELSGPVETHNPLTINTDISGSYGLVKKGTASLTLGGTGTDNTYNSDTIVEQGSLILSSGTLINLIPDNSDVVISNGASMTVNLNETIGSLQGAGNVIVSSGKVLQIGGDFGFGDGVYSGTIYGAGSIKKDGMGELTLSGSNAWAGSLVISNGSVKLGKSQALPAGRDVAIEGPGLLNLAGYTNSIGRLLGGGEVDLGMNGNLTVNMTVLAGSYNGSIRGQGVVKKTGTYTLTLNASSDYVGSLDVIQGAVALGNNYVLCESNVVSIASGATLGMSGKSQSLGGIAGGGTVQIGAADLTVGASGTNTTFNGVIEGFLGKLYKTGTGMFTFNGTNSGNVDTFIQQGAINLGSTGLLPGPVTISEGAKLSGTGRVGVTTVGGTIDPGASPGTLTTASETWEGGGVYKWEINNADGAEGSNPGWDVIIVEGGLTVNATIGNRFIIDISSFGGAVSNFNNAQDYSWRILASSNTITGDIPGAFELVTSNFANPLGNGVFQLAKSPDQKDLILHFVHPPDITTQLNSAQTNNAGGTAMFWIAASGTIPFSYQWKKDGTDIAGATMSMLTIHNLSGANAGTYAVEVSNIGGSVMSSNCVLTVNDPYLWDQPYDRTNEVGSEASFYITASGANLTYQWQKNGVDLVGGANLYGVTGPGLTINPVNRIDAGAYQVVVTSDFGAATSQVATLTVPTNCVNGMSMDIKGWWPADEYTAQDHARGNHGIETNVAYIAGKKGEAFNFYLGGAEVRVPNWWTLEPYSSMTIEAWVRSGYTPNPDEYIVGKGYHTNDASYALYSSTNGGLQFYVNLTDHGRVASPNIPPGSIWDDAYHHVAGVFDGSHVRIYLDGVEVGAGTPATNSMYPSILYEYGPDLYANGDVFFGSYGGTNHWKGMLDEVALYGMPLTSLEIEELYSAAGLGKCGLPAHVWEQAPSVVGEAPGYDVQIGVVVGGTPPITYQWYKNGSPIFDDTKYAGTGTPVLLVQNLEYVDAGAYHVVVSNAFGQDASYSSQLEITNYPPSVTIWNPKYNEVLPAYTPFSVDVEAADSQGVSYVYLYTNSVYYAMLSNAPYHFEITNAGQGAYVLEAYAMDSLAAMAWSAPVSINLSSLRVVSSSVIGGSPNEQGLGISLAGTNLVVSGTSDVQGGEGMLARYVLPFSSNSVPTWSTNWPGKIGADRFNAVAAVPSGIYVAGHSYQETTDQQGTKQIKGIVAKYPLGGPLSTNQGVVWKKQVPNAPGAFSFSGTETILDIAPVMEGNNQVFYVCGSAQASFYNEGRLFLSKVKSDGTVDWTVNDLGTSSSTNQSLGRALIIYNNNVYVAGSIVDEYGSWRPYLRKYSTAGALQWSRMGYYGHYYGLTAHAGGIYCVGASGEGIQADYMIEKWDENGGIEGYPLWNSVDWMGFENEDVLKSVVSVGNRLYAVGYTTGDTVGGKDAVIVEIDAEWGVFLTEKLWGGYNDDQANDCVTDGMEIYVVGQTASYGPSGENVFVLRVDPAQPLLPVEVKSDMLPSGFVGRPYAISLQAIGGKPPYAWSLVPSNTLPAGLTLTTNGMLQGTPTEQGLFNFEVAASDANEPMGSGSAMLTLFVADTNTVPEVTLDSPLNGAAYLVTDTIPLTALVTASNPVHRVIFYVNGEFFGAVSNYPYTADFSSEEEGTFSIKARVEDVYGAYSFSAPVYVTTMLLGKTRIDFESLETLSGDVTGVALSNYLVGFGIQISNEAPAVTVLAGKSHALIGGGNEVRATSGRNLLTLEGTNATTKTGKTAYWLIFNQGYASVSFSRAIILANNRGITHPGWRVTAFDGSGNMLSTTGEDQFSTYSEKPPRTFKLFGPDIYKLRIEADDRFLADYNSVLLDDLTLSTTEENQPPSVNVMSPMPYTEYGAPASFDVEVEANDVGGSVAKVELYLNQNFVGEDTNSMSTFHVENLGPGTYELRAVAIDNEGAVKVSYPVPVIVTNAVGVQVINFDALDASTRNVGGTNLANYLAQFGVRLTNVTTGAKMQAMDVNNLLGGSVVMPPSWNNVLGQVGQYQTLTYTLVFDEPVRSVTFTRPGLVAPTTGVRHPEWTARAYNASGDELTSVGEDRITTFSNAAPQTYLLMAPGIKSVRFDSDNKLSSSFAALLVDDIILDTNVVINPMSVFIESPANNASFTFPAEIVITAQATNEGGSIQMVDFYAGPQYIGTATNLPFSVTWADALPGEYMIAAVAYNEQWQAQYSSPVMITVEAGQGGGNVTMITFDELNAGYEPVSGEDLDTFLLEKGVRLINASPWGPVQVLNQTNLAMGNTVQAPTPQNILTQVGNGNEMEFTLEFLQPLTSFSFTRPKLLPTYGGVSHPEWWAFAYDMAGNLVSTVGEYLWYSYESIPQQTFTLWGAGIKTVRFASTNYSATQFPAVLLDNLVLTRSGGNIPPAIWMTSPTSMDFTAPASILCQSEAVDPDGEVTEVEYFYVNRWGKDQGETNSIGSASTPPYNVWWTNRTDYGWFEIFAVATDNLGQKGVSMPLWAQVMPDPNVFAIMWQPQDAAAGSGYPAYFWVGISGTNEVAYQWLKDGTPLADETNAMLALMAVTEADEGSYSVIVSNIHSRIALTSETAALEVEDAPEITTEPQGQTVSAGSTVSLSVTATGAPPLFYQWRMNGQFIQDATNATYTIPSAQPWDAGAYDVFVYSQYGYIQSEVASVFILLGTGGSESADAFADRIAINPLVSAVLGNNSTATLEDGEPVHAGKEGGRSVWYTWQAPFDGVICLSTKGSSFDTLMAIYTGDALTNLTLVASDDDSGAYYSSEICFNATQGTSYHIAIDGLNGASGNVVLGLASGQGYQIMDPNAGEQIPRITVHPESSGVEAGGTAVLSVVASSPTPLTYQWYYNNTAMSGGSDSTLTITNFSQANVGRYYVMVANETGSARSRRAVLQMVSEEGGRTSSDKLADSKVIGGGGGAGAGSRGKISPASGGTSRGYSSTQVFSTVGASKEAGEPNHCGVTGGASEWFAYTAERDGTLHVNTDGSGYNTILAVYTWPAPATNYATLVEQACNNVSGNGGDRVRFSVTQGTTYYIAVDGVSGASGNVKLNLNLGDAPSVSAAPQNATAVQGASVTLNVTATGSSNLVYRWRKGSSVIAGATNASFNISSLQSTNTGTYSVIISNGVNSVTSSVANVSIGIPLEISSQPQSKVVLQGGSATFSVTASGTEPISYQWRLNGTPIGGATSSSYTDADVQPADEGSYTVVITNEVGAVTSSVVALTIASQPALSAQPQAIYRTLGSTAIFSVTASGGALSYQWRSNGVNLVNGGAIAGATSGALTLAPVSTASVGSYYVVVTNLAGSVTSSAASLSVISGVAITTQPVGTAVMAGQKVTLRVAAIGTSPAYQWYKAGAPVADATNATLVFTPTALANAGNYTVVVTNMASAVTSAVAAVTVSADVNAPTVKIISPAKDASMPDLGVYSVPMNGLAEDKQYVSQVLVSLNGGATNEATLIRTNDGKKAFWSIVAPVVPGTNIAVIKSLDYTGNASATLTNRFFWDVLSPITLVTNGEGGILLKIGTAVVTNGQLLKVGRPYLALAVPGTNGLGWLFTNWGGTTYSLTNKYTFLMQTNMVLQANYLSNLFTRAAGTYYGLFIPGSGATHESAGFIKAKTDKKQAISGDLYAGGVKVGFKGKLGLDGRVIITNQSRWKVGRPELTMDLQLDLSDDTKQITGTIAQGVSWTADLVADKETFNKTNNQIPVAMQGRYSMLIPPVAGPTNAPGGWGYAFFSAISNGILKVEGGYLGDGTPFKALSLPLSKDYIVPCFVYDMYKGTNVIYTNGVAYKTNNAQYNGSVLGWLSLVRNTNAPLYTNAVAQTNYGLVGELSWIKTGWTNLYYPNGFTNVTAVYSSRHTLSTITNMVAGKPVWDARAMTNWTDGTKWSVAGVRLAQGGLSVTNENAGVYNVKSEIVTNSLGATFKLKVDPKTGLISGQFSNTEQPQIHKLFGIGLQEWDFGAGYFVNPLATPPMSGFFILTGQ